MFSFCNYTKKNNQNKKNKLFSKNFTNVTLSQMHMYHNSLFLDSM